MSKAITTPENAAVERVSGRAATFLFHFARFIFTLLIARSGFLGQALPFGASIIAVLPLNKKGWSGIAGVLIGYALLSPDSSGIRYIACALVVIGVRKLFAALGLECEGWFLAALCGCVAFATGFAEFLRADGGTSSLLFLCCEALLCAGFFIIVKLLEKIDFHNFSFEKLDLSERYSVILTGFVLLLSLCTISFGGFSPGRAFAFTLVLALAFVNGPGVGCMAGVAAGIAALMTANFDISFATLCFAGAGICAGVSRKLSRLPAAVIALAIAGCTAVLLGGTNAALCVAELFFGAVLFSLLPLKIIFCVGRGAPPEGEPLPAGTLVARIKSLSAAFHELAKSAAPDESKNEGDISTVYSVAANKTCRNCGLNHFCWGRDYNSVMHALQATTPQLQKKGKLTPADLADGFMAKCVRLPDFCGAVSAEYSARTRAKLRVLCDDEEQVKTQFGTLGDLLDGLSCELTNTITFDEGLELRLKSAARAAHLHIKSFTAFTESDGALCIDVCTGRVAGELTPSDEICELLCAETGLRFFPPTVTKSKNGFVSTYLQRPEIVLDVARAAVKKEGEVCSGDSSCFFESPDGKYCIMLSDGMGSGAAAASESGFAVRCFEKLQKSGVSREAALGIINSALTQRKNECFATSDLCVVNRFSGEAEIIKAGAAPTLLVRDRKIYRIESGSLPAGILLDAETERQRCILEPFDLIIMMSDGVLSNGEDIGFLRDTILGYDERSERSLAAQILAECRRQKPAPHDDDMTCFTIFVLRAEELAACDEAAAS